MMPKTVFEPASAPALKLGGAGAPALRMKVFALPLEEKMVRLSALKKLAWNCRSTFSKRLVRLERDKSSLMDAGDRPSSDYLVDRSAVIQEALALAHGKLIGIAERDDVGDIRAGDGAICLGVVVVLGKGAGKDGVLRASTRPAVGVGISDGL